MIFSFGDCRIDTAACELFRAGARQNIEPQVLDLLLLLIENRERVVTREQIVEEVWKGRIVSDAAISSRIKTARQLIGDTGETQDYIRTLRGRGFRFVAPVEIEGAAETAGVAPAAGDLSPHPETRYAKSGDVHIAYQLFGEGPIDLVLMPGFVSQIDNYWDDPRFNQWLSALGKIARVAIFDKRGTGLSDQVPHLPGMDERMDDVRAVMDAVGFDKAVIMGISEGGSLATLFAASQPHRVTGLVLYGAFAKFTSWFPNDAALQVLFDYVESAWGSGHSVGNFAPSVVGDEAFRVWWGKFERLGATPKAVVDLMLMNKEIDISDTLPLIAVPALVVHRAEDTLVSVEGGRFLAANIPDARYVELSGPDHLPWVGETAPDIINSIAEFVETLPDAAEAERFMATVMAVKLDDKPVPGASEDLPLGPLEGAVRLAVTRNGGSTMNVGGAAVAARFNGPAKALRCATEIVGLLDKTSLGVRAGVHTGEVVLSDSGAGGMAADGAAEIAVLAGPGEIIASRTVKDLVAGSRVAFESAGAHKLSGVDEAWEMYRALPGAPRQGR